MGRNRYIKAGLLLICLLCLVHVKCESEGACIPEDEFVCKTSKLCIFEYWKCDGEEDCLDGSDEKNCTVSCPDDHLSCDNRTRCIPSSMSCDKVFNCLDKSDEKDCPADPKSCPRDQFRCKVTHDCIQRAFICDGDDDCGDGTDELKPLCCQENEWRCWGSEKCINITKVCDGQYDCVDQSDERATLSSSCSKNECASANCSHECQQTPFGAKCYCPQGYELQKDTKSCQDIDECEGNVCDHICNNKPGSYRCSCYLGYQLVNDRYCKSNENDPPSLLIAWITKILNASIDGKEVNTLEKDLHRAVALDYHFQKQLVFFTDVGTKQVYQATYGKNDAKPILSAGLYMPDGIAVDWVAENIYLAESKGNRIDVMSMDGKYRQTIIENLGLPRGIAVDPSKMCLFYTDWGSNQAKIARCSMDGKKCIALANTNVTWPNAITLDYVKKLIYWADASHDVIYSADYNGGDRKVIAGGPGQDSIPHPFAITLYQGFIYVTDWRFQGIYKVDILNSGKVSTVIKSLSQPMDIQLYHASRQNYSVNYCKDVGCDHLGLLSYVTPERCQCVCGIGYSIHTDGKSCVKYNQFVLIAGKTHVRGYHFDNGTTRDVFVPVIGLTNTVGVDYDVKEQMLYFSDVTIDSIERMKFDGSGRQQVVNTSLMNPDGLAVDWVARNLYWTDAGQKKISVCRLDGSFRHTLIHTNIDKPRAIVMHPKIGTMFWGDWGSTPKIEKAYMDGSNRTVIVSAPYLAWPNGLAIDYATSRLYWVDAQLDNMRSVNFDGGELTVLLTKLSHPFGMDVYDGYVYWDDWVETKLWRTSLSNPETSKEVLLDNAKGLMEVRVYKRGLISDDTDACSKQPSCEHLCLLHSSTQKTCACQDGFELNVKDDRTCVASVASTPTTVKATCSGDQFQCDSGKCISRNWVCDRDFDCLDHSDELQNCDNTTCGERYFQCHNNKCIAETYLCDGDYDCEDRSDETNCTAKNCDDGEFLCDGTSCKPNLWKCDGAADCNDETDELGCDIKNETCDGFTCLSSRSCIPATWRCNSIQDCSDGSDEQECDTRSCSPAEFRCANGVCIQYDWHCDDDVDCDDNSDEQNCTVSCRTDQFACHNGGCISKLLTCDEQNDCQDWSDEQMCSRNCSAGEFQCNNTLCIHKSLVCNDVDDCGDTSDEGSCPCLPPNKFKCKNNNCLGSNFTCDGVDDCGDNSDEGVEICGCARDDEYHCANSSICLPRQVLCDKHVDCPGKDDESFECRYQECQYNNGGCSHVCTNSPTGSLCSCPAGLGLNHDNTTCSDLNECDLPWSCSQTCVNKEKSYSCSCVEGYKALPGKRSCKAVHGGDEVPFLIISNRVSLRKIAHPFDRKKRTFSDIITGLRNIIGVDFDWKDQKLYWSDVTTDKIQRANFDGSFSEIVVSGGLAAAEGIAVDWVGRNLYWLDMRADRIEVARLDGTHRTVLFTDDIDSPRALQVDPRHGYLFWTDWGSKPAIERSNMDGSDRRKIVTTKLVWPNGMTLDYPTNRVYWVDAKLNRLEFCDYDGQRRFPVLSESSQRRHPFSSSIFEDKIFWTDWLGNAVRYTSKYPGGNITEIYTSTGRVMDLHVVHPVKQPKGVNYCANATCSHLCVLRPRGHTCLCPIGFTLKQHSCKAVDNFLVYSRRSEINAISLNQDKAERMIPVMALPDAIAVDFDHSEDRIYWSDVTDDSISRIFVNGTGLEKIIKPGTGLRSPDGIAVDWVAKNVYWTDSASDVISVARTDGRYHRVILSKSEYLNQPRGIALYPSKGLLFWTDWGHKSIQRARLDGSDIKTLINTSLNFVNGITIDYDHDRFYFVDAAFVRIESATLDGTDRKVIVPSGPHPFGISVFNGSIYWSDWSTTSIEKVNMDGSNHVVLKARLQGVMGISVFSEQRQPGTNACSHNNGGCPQLCLWTGEKVQCACSRGYVFKNGECEPSGSFLVYSKVNEFLSASFDANDQSVHLPFISVTINCYAIDFLYAKAAIFFTDDAKNAIGRINVDGSGMEYIITTGLNRPHGLAVDWVARNLFWTDMGTKLIEVSRLDGSHRVPIISRGLEKPRDIVLDPAEGVMFWTDWGTLPRIQKANMDGSVQKSLIVNNTDYIVWPNGLTLDYQAKLLYWIDGKLGIVGRMGYNGENKVILVRGVRNGYGLTIFGDYIYASLAQTNQVLRIQKTSDHHVTKFRSPHSRLPGPSDVFAYDKTRQRPSGVCQNHECEQLCLPSVGQKYRCVCASGQLSNDGKHCRESSAFLIYAIRSQIRFLYLDPKKKATVPFPAISGLNKHAAVALDFDYAEKLLFFTVLKKSIFSVNINGSGLKEINLPIVPDGISVDWMAKQIYLTDAANDKIRRIDYNGGNLTTVITVGLREPRAIVVMPCDSMMFWTDWGVPSIERSLLNGINRRVLVNSSLGWPNGLTIDNSTMYWVDARLDRIESANLDGSERRVIIENLPHPFAVTVLGSSIYWSDWAWRKVMKADKLSGGSQIALTTGTLNYQPMDVQVFTAERQNCSLNPCRNNGGCSQLCTAVGNQRQCSCRDGYKLLNGFRCVREFSNCSHSQFTCANGQCIPRFFICDTDDDCSDKSDELDIICDKHTCPVNTFQCNNGKCIAKRWRCDFDDDCHDNSDEVGCVRPTCLQGQFACTNGRCVNEAFRCDADNDCRDFSDETGCPPVRCPAGRQPCSNNSMCIQSSWICDGDDDCGDNSDESKERCYNSTCLQSEIKCAKTGRCIPARWRCDGDDDCGDNSDETGNCTHSDPCKAADFTCKNGNCVSKTFLCDGDNDCGDNSDESLSNCSLRTCGVLEFKCYNTSRCIPRTYVCDGDNDCGDASDEHPREGCTHPTCGPKDFRCDNSICIRKAWQCDHENDCGDGSDERSCTYGTCSPQHFTCKNKQCVTSDYRCDLDKDCTDGSDEEGCSNPPVQCSSDEFQCVESRRCISSRLVCDKSYDCDDDSDEKDCHRDECKEDITQMCHNCTDLPSGFQCTCHSGSKLINRTKCVDIDECLDNVLNNCSHFCLNLSPDPKKPHSPRFKCLCRGNYSLARDGHSCKYRGDNYPVPYLVFADRYDIRKLSTNSRKYTKVVSDLTNAVALDYDYKTRRIYWSSNSPNGIKSAFFNGSDVTTVVSQLKSSPDGIAVDWVERNLYFCESSESAIYVSTLSGHFLKKLKEGLKEPRGMVLSPDTGYLYFTDWRQSCICRIGMDGSRLSSLVTRKVGWPNGLTIDYESRKLFWVDARLDTIEYADLDGGNRKILPNVRVAHPFAITLFQDTIFWTDWVTKGIHKCHKWSGRNHVIMKNTTHKPMDIQIVHPLRQANVQARCPGRGTRQACHGLCLRSPRRVHQVGPFRTTISPGYRCACPDNFYLSADNRTCQSNCKLDEFECANLKCIKKLWKCDGENDCGDNSDEPVSGPNKCPKRYCPPGRYQCANRNCTSPFHACDGEDDCGDGSDEKDCPKTHCSSLKFRCNNKRCISKSLKCNGNNDCGDRSDEVGCASNATCKSHEIECNTSRECIPKTAKCDGYLNCKDGSDEDPGTCPKVTCPKEKFLCSYRCIPQSWVCDSSVDCPDKSDEMHCEAKRCRTAELFACSNDKCVPAEWKCDNEDDCGDASDERNCTYELCKPPNFRCKDNDRCIDADWKCDGAQDCIDGSDEQDCPKTCDKHSQFRCRQDGYCVPKELRCDGQKDCRDSSDEMQCPGRGDGDQRCRSDEFECKNTLCVNKYMKCDGLNDCHDNSDEDPEMCAKHACTLLEFRCTNVSTCVPLYQRCDGRKNCPDNSDEASCAPIRHNCGVGDFKCADGSRCVRAKKRCDQRKDCDDASDEAKCVGSCTIATFGVCQQNCVDSLPGPGYYCTCRHGYQVNASNAHVCEDVDECAIFGKCSQKCVNSKGSYKCSCYEGYQLSYPGDADRPICRVKGPAPTIIVPNVHGIHRYSTSGHRGHSLVKTDSKVSAVDFLMFHNESFVIWSDVKTKTIKMAAIKEQDGRRRRAVSDTRTIVQTSGVAKSFAVDSVGKNVFWINDQQTSKTIEVASIFGRGHRVLVRPYRFEQPKHLVLQLEKGKMFWCSVGLIPKIEVASLTGEHRRVLVRSKLSWPSGLALDDVTDRLYWCDMKENEIETIFTNGSDRQVVLHFNQLQGDYSEPYFIDVFEDFLYIVTRRGLAFKWNKFGHGRPEKLLKTEPEVGLKIMHHFRHNHELAKMCQNTTCSDICVATANDTTCLCSDGQGDKQKCNQVSPCHQYCVRGTCRVSYGKPYCSCPSDAAGVKCEQTCGDHDCGKDGKCFIKNNQVQCLCPDNTTGSDCSPSVQNKQESNKGKLIMEILMPVVFGLLIVIAVVAILYCRCRGVPSRKFAPFYGSRKASFTYTGMFDDDDDDDDDVDGKTSHQFVINDSEVNFANPVYNSLFVDGPSPGDYTEVNRQLIFQDDENRVDFSNPIYDSFYASNEGSELDSFLPNNKPSPDASSVDSFGSHDSVRDSMTRLVKD